MVALKAKVADLCTELDAVRMTIEDCGDAVVALTSEIHQQKSAVSESTVYFCE